MNNQRRNVKMKRPKLLKKYKKFISPSNRLGYKKQTKYCSELLKQNQDDFCNSLVFKM